MTRDLAMDSVCVSVMEKSSGRQATAVIWRRSIEGDYPGSIYRAVAECEKKLQLFDPVAETNHDTLAPGQYAKINDGYPMPQVLPQKQSKPKINQSVTARFGHLDIPEKA